MDMQATLYIMYFFCISIICFFLNLKIGYFNLNDICS
jgi:hypothetical protein